MSYVQHRHANALQQSCNGHSAHGNYISVYTQGFDSLMPSVERDCSYMTIIMNTGSVMGRIGDDGSWSC